ncbi:MAG: hypothetical protein NTV86_20685 [Planctomycetota bacterium]|nr:hypothetical protein [Planctomycetota bacterium]
MALKDAFVAIGGKLGLIRMVSTTATAGPGKIPTRKVTLAELSTEIRAEQIRELTEQPVELSLDFAKIFEAAGIAKLSHGWTVDKLEAVLAGPPVAGMDRTEAQKAVLAMLTADKAHVHEVVQEAMARDKALDAFEVFAHKKTKQRVESCQSRIVELESQIASLRQQADELHKEADANRAAWKAWHQRKVECEKAMARTLGILVEDAAITIDGDGDEL